MEAPINILNKDMIISMKKWLNSLKNKGFKPDDTQFVGYLRYTGKILLKDMKIIMLLKLKK